MTAVVVLREGEQASADDILAHARNTAGKILKRQLGDEYAEAAVVDETLR